jgi:hypothetical protein
MRVGSNLVSRNMLVGSLLGDLNMQYMGASWRIRALQHIKHEDWLRILHFHLEPNNLVRFPKYDKYNRIWFNTLTINSVELNNLGFKFYPYATPISVGRKVVPIDIANLLTEPEGLAAWFMDDGSKRSTSGYILCTDCFQDEEVDLLRDMLASNFGISETSINRKDGNPRLRIKAGSAVQFRSIIEPHIVPSFRYKL